LGTLVNNLVDRAADVQAAMTVLTRGLVAGAGQSLNLSRVDRPGADLAGATLTTPTSTTPTCQPGSDTPS
jgi:hypothetical protein